MLKSHKNNTYTVDTHERLFFVQICNAWKQFKCSSRGSSSSVSIQFSSRLDCGIKRAASDSRPNDGSLFATWRWHNHASVLYYLQHYNFVSQLPQRSLMYFFYIDSDNWQMSQVLLTVLRVFFLQFIDSNLLWPTYIEGPVTFTVLVKTLNKRESTNWHVLLMRFSILSSRERERERDLKRDTREN